MKKNIILKGLIGLLGIGGLASCSSDYLDLKPITSISSATATGSAETLGYGVNAIGVAMNRYYGNYTWIGFTGEASFGTMYGEFEGQDALYWIAGQIEGGQIVNMQANERLNMYMAILGWQYCYGILGQCNDLLANAENATGDEAEKNFRIAQLLTYRAHAFSRLLQVYAPRWQDSNNGEALTVVLRTEPGIEDLPMAPMNDVLNQIYSDLDRALELYDQAGSSRRDNIGEPDRNIACGVYARAALLKNDWETAKKYAHEAQAGYNMATNNDILGGYAGPASDTMWTSSLVAADWRGYAAHGSYFACNGPYQFYWSVGAGSINKQLYDLMPEGDIRRTLFVMPDKFADSQLKNFYDPDATDPLNMNIYNPPRDQNDTTGPAGNLRFARAVQKFVSEYQPTGATLSGDLWPAAYCPPADAPADNEGAIFIPFGAQLKFWGYDQYGTNAFPFMRATEMYLIEAEAAAELGDAATAQSILNKLNAMRQEGLGYNCTKTGRDLVDEVRLQRRFELWGEGFNWFDFKRWNLPIDRKGWLPGDTNSGNIPANCAVRIEPQDCNKWVIWIPQNEVNYNDLISETDLVR